MYYPDVPALDPEDIELLCNEYIAHNKHLDPHIADRLGVKRGLRNPDGTGVLAGITNVSSVIGYEKLPEGTIRPISGRLVYRGIDIDTLAAEADKNDRFMFEEVVWLLLFGALPTQEQYARFCKLIDEHRELPKGFADDMIMNSPSPNIMNKMARSVLSMYSYDEHADDLSLPNILTQSINLIAELPTMMVNAYQLKRRVYDHESKPSIHSLEDRAREELALMADGPELDLLIRNLNLTAYGADLMYRDRGILSDYGYVHRPDGQPIHLPQQGMDMTMQ